MDRRKLLTVAALVLAVPLFVWPIAFPPPDPPDTLVHFVDNIGGATPEGEDGIGRVAYENLSADGKRIVRMAAAADETSPTIEVSAGEGAPEVFDYNSAHPDIS